MRLITLIIAALMILCGINSHAQKHTTVNLGPTDSTGKPTSGDGAYKILISYYSPADKQHLDEFQQLICSYLDLYIANCAVMEKGDVKLKKSKKETLRELNNIVKGALEFYEYKPLKSFKSFSVNVEAKLESLEKIDFNAAGTLNGNTGENEKTQRFYFEREIESLKELARMEVGVYASANVLMKDSSSEMLIDSHTKDQLVEKYTNYEEGKPLEPIRIDISDDSQAIIDFQDISTLEPSLPNSNNPDNDFAKQVLELLKNNNSKLDGMQKQIDDLRAEQIRLWQTTQDEKNLALQKQIDDLKEIVLTMMQANAGEPVVTTEKASSPSGKSVTVNLPKSVNVFFSRGSSQLDANSRLMLNEVVDILARNPQLQIIITGFADKTGDPGKNLLLSEQRAMAVQKFISQSGLPKTRFITNYFGDSASGGENSVDRKVVIGFVQ